MQPMRLLGFGPQLEEGHLHPVDRQGVLCVQVIPAVQLKPGPRQVESPFLSPMVASMSRLMSVLQVFPESIRTRQLTPPIHTGV